MMPAALVPPEGWRPVVPDDGGRRVYVQAMIGLPPGCAPGAPPPAGGQQVAGAAPALPVVAAPVPQAAVDGGLVQVDELVVQGQALESGAPADLVAPQAAPQADVAAAVAAGRAATDLAPRPAVVSLGRGLSAPASAMGEGAPAGRTRAPAAPAPERVPGASVAGPSASGQGLGRVVEVAAAAPRSWEPVVVAEAAPAGTAPPRAAERAVVGAATWDVPAESLDAGPSAATAARVVQGAGVAVADGAEVGAWPSAASDVQSSRVWLAAAAVGGGAQPSAEAQATGWPVGLAPAAAGDGAEAPSPTGVPLPSSWRSRALAAAVPAEAVEAGPPATPAAVAVAPDSGAPPEDGGPEPATRQAAPEPMAAGLWVLREPAGASEPTAAGPAAAEHAPPAGEPEITQNANGLGERPVPQPDRAGPPQPKHVHADSDRPGQAAPAREPARGKPLAEERPQPWGHDADEAVGGGERRDTSLPSAHRVAARGARDDGPSGPPAGPTRPAALPAVESLAAAPAVGRSEGGVGDGPAPGQVRELALAAPELDRELPGLVVQQARLAQRGQPQELRVRVRPPELGEIRISFQSRDGELTGSVVAERAVVRGWLAAEAPAWREELAEAGVDVARIDVDLMPQSGADGQAPPWQGGAPRSWADAAPGPPPEADPATQAEPGAAGLGVNAARGAGRIDYLA